jgi:starch synthase
VCSSDLTYAGEILTPEFGCGLEQYLLGRVDEITGILNGLDTQAWDPAKDKSLAMEFSQEDPAGRAGNKSALQKQLDFPIRAKVPILAMVGRVDPQKGVDITLGALERLSKLTWQFVLLGTGDAALEQAILDMLAKHPDRIRAVTRYDASLGRMIYGGADMFLMPSRYEPCGLAQMIAMRYGCVPVVRATGGLKDTVKEGRTGFVFDKPSPEAMARALRRALAAYASPARWRRFQQNGMKQDFSWPRSARQYAAIYRSLVPAL